jgi:hypothetical protein
LLGDGVAEACLPPAALAERLAVPPGLGDEAGGGENVV